MLILKIIGTFVAILLLSFFTGFFFDFDNAREGKSNKLFVMILSIIQLVLFVVIIKDISKGIFYNFDHFLLLILKVAVYLPTAVFVLISCIGWIKRKSWKGKIDTALENGLGSFLISKIPSNARGYWVDETSILWGNEYNKNNYVGFTFKSLGYQDIPVEYADIICEFIKDKIVNDPELYSIKQISQEKTSYVTESGHIETTRTVSGYNSKYVKGDTTETRHKAIYGYRLLQKSLDDEHRQSKKLNKW